jgi:hypothetical protein
MFFFTAADTERLNIRGSRDPLGLVPIWGDFGRKVVENLTTASNSARGFTTMLLGLHFAERVSEGETDREEKRLAAFLKFEQLAGFARVVRNDDGGMRGITQIRKRLADGEGRRIRIGASPDLQILGNQKTYGIWGLFMMPAIDSGLVVPKDLVLTPVARELLEREYLPAFRIGGRDEADTVESVLARPSCEVQPNGTHRAMFEALGKVLHPSFRAKEQQFYHYHLVLGGDAAAKRGWQPRVADLIETRLPPRKAFNHESIDTLISATSRASDDAELHEHLKAIRDLEAFLVAAANLFGFLQHRDRAVLAKVVGELRDVWGRNLREIDAEAIEGVRGDLARILDDDGAGQRLVDLAHALNAGRYDDAIDLVLGHNQFVMHSRNGSQPWIRRNGAKLEVRYRDDSQKRILTRQEIANAWQSTFYIDPLKLVSDQLRSLH